MSDPSARPTYPPAQSPTEYEKSLDVGDQNAVTIAVTLSLVIIFCTAITLLYVYIKQRMARVRDEKDRAEYEKEQSMRFMPTEGAAASPQLSHSDILSQLQPTRARNSVIT